MWRDAKIQQEGRQESREGHARAQAWNVEERQVRQESNEQETGDSDWSIRGSRGRREGPQEGFQEELKEGLLEEKVIILV